METIKYAFDTYGELSGQAVSLEKYKVYFGKFVTFGMCNRISAVWHLSKGFLPFTYLGVPLFKGRPKKEYLLPISDSIKLKLTSWKGKSLFMVGRLTLIKISDLWIIYSFLFHI